MHITTVEGNADGARFLMYRGAAIMPWEGTGERGLEGVNVVVAPADWSWARIHEYAQSNEHWAEASAAARGGDFGEIPAMLKTDLLGRAKYSELRIHVVPFTRPGLVGRRVLAMKDGYVATELEFQIESGAYGLRLPIEPRCPQ